MSAAITRSTSSAARSIASAWRDGFVMLTSRVSIEMVQKSAAVNAGLVVAMSAPTALAVATAQEAGITLVAVARDDAFEVFTHKHRIRELA